MKGRGFMEILNKVNLLKKYRNLEKERSDMLELIDDARNRLATVSAAFNTVSDSDLVDYFIYEKRAAELNYKYLLKKYSETNYSMEKPKIFPCVFRLKKAE